MAVAVVLKVPKKKTPEQTQGEIIRLARESQGLTQAELGRLLGLTQRRISRIERGSCASSVMIFRIAKALKQPLDTFEV